MLGRKSYNAYYEIFHYLKKCKKKLNKSDLSIVNLLNLTKKGILSNLISIINNREVRYIRVTAVPNSRICTVCSPHDKRCFFVISSCLDTAVTQNISDLSVSTMNIKVAQNVILINIRKFEDFYTILVQHFNFFAFIFK